MTLYASYIILLLLLHRRGGHAHDKWLLMVISFARTYDVMYSVTLCTRTGLNGMRLWCMCVNTVNDNAIKSGCSVYNIFYNALINKNESPRVKWMCVREQQKTKKTTRATVTSKPFYSVCGGRVVSIGPRGDAKRTTTNVYDDGAVCAIRGRIQRRCRVEGPKNIHFSGITIYTHLNNPFSPAVWLSSTMYCISLMIYHVVVVDNTRVEKPWWWWRLPTEVATMKRPRKSTRRSY